MTSAISGFDHLLTCRAGRPNLSERDQTKHLRPNSLSGDPKPQRLSVSETRLVVICIKTVLCGPAYPDAWQASRSRMGSIRPTETEQGRLKPSGTALLVCPSDYGRRLGLPRLGRH